MAANKPIVIDCSEVTTRSQPLVTRTPAEWRTYFMNQVRICQKAEGSSHQWGSDAKERLVSKAKSQGIELTNLA